MRLLIAADSITTLNILLKEITARSWPSGTEARVLSILEDGEVPLETWRKEGYGVAAVRLEMRRRGRQISSLAVDHLRKIGIPAEITIMRGNPVFLIPFAARKWPADLILIRAHNRTDFRNRLLGSVAKTVVEGAPCTVDVIRTPPASHFGPGQLSARVLLATDGSDESLAAVQALGEMNWPEHSEVKVVSVVNPMIYSLEEIGLLRGNETDRAHRAIGDALKALKGKSLKISGEVIAGSIARQIIDRAKLWGASLIVFGTHERQGLKRFLFGSTSAAVAERAHCSVKVIRGRAVSHEQESLPRRLTPPVQKVGSVYKSPGFRRAA